jgi:hypothetical protein
MDTVEAISTAVCAIVSGLVFVGISMMILVFLLVE